MMIELLRFHNYDDMLYKPSNKDMARGWNFGPI